MERVGGERLKTGGGIKNRHKLVFVAISFVIQLGLEPRALSLKVKCSTD